MSVNYFLPRDPADPYKFRHVRDLSTEEIDLALYSIGSILDRGEADLVEAVTVLAEIQRELLRRCYEKEESDTAGVTATLG